MNFSKDVRVAANMSSVFTLALPHFRDFQTEGLDRHQVFAVRRRLVGWAHLGAHVLKLFFEAVTGEVWYSSYSVRPKDTRRSQTLCEA